MPRPYYDYIPRDGRVVIDPAKLRHWRNVRMMTREELAEASYLSLGSIQAYETGWRCPKDESFRRLYTALGVGPEDLLYEGGRYVPKRE